MQTWKVLMLAMSYAATRVNHERERWKADVSSVSVIKAPIPLEVMEFEIQLSVIASDSYQSHFNQRGFHQKHS